MRPPTLDLAAVHGALAAAVRAAARRRRLVVIATKQAFAPPAPPAAPPNATSRSIPGVVLHLAALPRQLASLTAHVCPCAGPTYREYLPKAWSDTVTHRLTLYCPDAGRARVAAHWAAPLQAPAGDLRSGREDGGA